ncbi:hypothetical protein V3C99_008999 [Haemonchus contortus]|uniref:Hydrophobin n=1 Tax=Haemonchus contortus TaxID=6289 RepID=A0A7I4YJP2_HAECO|nr:kunitz/Bovine pancreatic trypsin inhibitor [Haemonchus contortus]CDJ92027.1 Hypothetical protein CBG13891 [Haemonchus contortus]
MHSILLITIVPLVLSRATEKPQLIPPCPTGSRPLLRPDGEPRKCLPHQNSLCVNALPDRHNATTVCCYNNQVDYFCCLDTTAEECPYYEHVTVVIHNGMPHNPYGMREFFFREGVEDDVVDAAIQGASDNFNDLGLQQENGFLVRHNNE